MRLGLEKVVEEEEGNVEVETTRRRRKERTPFERGFER